MVDRNRTSAPDRAQDRVGFWMQTASGRRFWPLDPRADEVHIEDIAASLSKICRFGGHCSEFYSVAQHSVFVAHLVERAHPGLALHALLHDAAEAYIGDVIKPLKDSVRFLREHIDDSLAKTEQRILIQVRRAFELRDLDGFEQADICEADLVALATEARDVMRGANWGIEPDASRVVPIAPAAAEREFLAAFDRLKLLRAQRS